MNLKQTYTGKCDKVLAPPAEENREHDRHDDEDWVQIGQNGLEKDELVLETTSPDIHNDVHEIFTLDANDLDLIEELDLMEVTPVSRGATVSVREGLHLILQEMTLITFLLYL
jgi:hypothetical protein